MNEHTGQANDRLIRAVAMDGLLRVTITRTTGVVEEIGRRHAMSPVATAATGRVATAALMLGTTLKDEQVLTIQVRGVGPMGMVRATADAHGTVRAYASEPNPVDPTGALTVNEAIGAQEGSLLEVIKDLGLKEPYHGLVPLVTGSIYEDVAYYLLTSEQTRSAVALGERLEGGTPAVCGGYLVQALPGAGDEVEDQIKKLPPIHTMLGEDASLEDILERLLPGVEKRVVSDYPVRFACTCSRERFTIGLRLVGEAEAMSILRQEGSPLKLRCHFCNEEYRFTELQLRRLFTAH